MCGTGGGRELHDMPGRRVIHALEFDGRWYRDTVRARKLPLVLAPGQQKDAIRVWLGLGWWRKDGPNSPNLTPGRHTVRVAFTGTFGNPRTAEDAMPVRAVSNPVEITIETALPGGRLSLEEAVADPDFAFAAACEAFDDFPEEIRTGRQTFKVVEVLGGHTPDRAEVRVRYHYWKEQAHQERPIRGAERVIWVLGRPSADSKGFWPGIKALPDTPENRKAVTEAVEKEAYWGPVSNGLQCRLLPLEQTVEVVEGQKPEDIEVNVTYELRNVGERPVKFLPWDTPLEKTLAGDIFRVEGPDGKQVDYVGEYVDRGPPKPKDYVTIAPGQTLTNRIWLSYNFGNEGAYKVSITTTREPSPDGRKIMAYYDGDPEKAKQNPDNDWTGTLTSNTVTVNVVRPAS